MENYTSLFCKDIPLQATSACFLVNLKDGLLAAKQGPMIAHQNDHKKLTDEATYMICVILTFVGLSAIGTSITVYEFFVNSNKKNFGPCRNNINGKKDLKEDKSTKIHDYLGSCKSFLECFCIVKNGKKILSTSSTEGLIGCFHGLRFFSNAWTIIEHVGFAFVSVVRHVPDIKPVLDLRASQIALNGIFSVDVFFVISGFLNAKAFFHKYSRSNGNISWFHFYFKRFARLTPVYMVVLGFHATLLSYTGKGILWPTFNTNPACLKDWWKHLLYINNFERADNQCMAWCWYSAADMQFYIISPLFMLPLIKWPRIGYALALAGISVSWISSFLLTYHYNLVDGYSRFEFHLDDSKTYAIEFWRYFDIVYSKPYTRLSSYLIAILLAYYFHKKSISKATRNSAMSLRCGWILAGLSMWLCLLSLHKIEEILLVTSLYNASKHLLFSCSLAWVIYVCLTGQADFLNKYLSWKYFLPLSRLSYCAYLIHPLILTKTALEWEDLRDFNYIWPLWLYLYICISTYAVSFFACLFVEMPALNLLDSLTVNRKEKRNQE